LNWNQRNELLNFFPIVCNLICNVSSFNTYNSMPYNSFDVLFQEMKKSIKNHFKTRFLVVCLLCCVIQNFSWMWPWLEINIFKFNIWLNIAKINFKTNWIWSIYRNSEFAIWAYKREHLYECMNARTFAWTSPLMKVNINKGKTK